MKYLIKLYKEFIHSINQEEFDRGYDYAAGLLLKGYTEGFDQYKEALDIIEAQMYGNYDHFDKGMYAAVGNIESILIKVKL